MSRPISPIVRTRLAARIATVRGCPPMEAVIEATKFIQFAESAGLDIVMPEWVPVDHPVVQDGPRRPRIVSWEDLPLPSESLLEREPWRPFDA